jgi:hypothetical protein
MLVVGGVNDTYTAYDQTAVANAVEEYINTAVAALPNLKKIYIAYNCTFNNPPLPENSRKSFQYRTRAGIIEGISRSPQITTYISGVDTLLTYNPYVDMTDGVHPTTMGHELIKREWIKAYKKS